MEARARAVVEELAALCRQLAVEGGLGPGEALPLPAVVLPVTVPLSDPQARTHAARVMAQALREKIGEGLKASAAFRRGRVFCFACDRGDCEHSLPISPTETFSRYSSVGRPEWISFTNLCIEKGEPRVGELYDSPPEIIAITQDAHELGGRLLPGFGKGSGVYNLLGQVVVGLVPERFDPSQSGGERAALTLQFIETRAGHPRLHLNLLGRTTDDIVEAATDQNARQPAERLRRLLGSLRGQVADLGRRAAVAERRGEVLDVEAEVERMLVPLGQELERIFKPPAARTRHAQERHIGAARPTSSALGDARNASPGQLFFDREHETIVVVGPKGRVHVFTPMGRHVTSIQLGPGELERKQDRRRWQALNLEQAASFKQVVAPVRGRG